MAGAEGFGVRRLFGPGWAVFAGCLWIAGPTLADASEEPSKANPAEALELPTVEIVGTTPLPGLGTSLQDVPANVQILTGAELARQRQSTVGDFLEQHPSGIATLAAQGNPF